ncbi:MAG: cytochrome c biogenesis protein DipZ [Pseudolysinimonas sp.]|uniref:cytochrome c biogenesis protein DipZ n=1 Tax=Pseudolysinimonas sp. TaxID=2680009 RepID=UPI003267A2FA
MSLTLILIGLLGGLVTGISPCILPVLPVIFLSGGAASSRMSEDGETKKPSRWRPFLVIAGLALSFSVVTLIGSLLLALIGLPQDVLRWSGIVVLSLIGIGLIVPQFQHLLEKPFSKIPQKYVSPDRNGFLLGAALGLVFVPCAGPVLAAITVAGSTGRIGLDTVVLTASFAIGTSVPLLIFALAGRGVAERIKAFRKRQGLIRVVGGVTMLALAVGLVFNLPALLQRLIPDYTGGIQQTLAESDEVQQALDLGGLVNDQNKDLDLCTQGATELESCGTAPDLTGITAWLNTPDGQAIDLADLHGKVVLIDFWTYACINCQRSLPHVTAWDQAYRDAGLQVIGIHAPEYAFEKEQRNVEQAIQDLGIDYPVAMDNSLSTWTNYRNRYWPASYLIDANGVVRHIHLGEGGYGTTEALIRQLLQDADPGLTLPALTSVEDDTPVAGSTTPETYLSAGKVVNYGGEGAYGSGDQKFSYPADQARDTFALTGDWTVDFQGATPTGGSAKVRLEYTATQEVRAVLGGSGTVIATVDGTRVEIAVNGSPNSYEVLKLTGAKQGEIELTVLAGVTVYSFTFG